MLRWVVAATTLIYLVACQMTVPQATHQAALYQAQLGLIYLDKGDVSLAQRKLWKALRLDPKTPEVYEAMAYYMEKTQHFDMADYYYHQALYYGHYQGRALHHYANFLCRLKRYREARPFFVKASRDLYYTDVALVNKDADLCLKKYSRYGKKGV